MEDVDKDLQEMLNKLDEFVCIDEDLNLNFEFKICIDLEKFKQVVVEKSKFVGEDGKLLLYFIIDLIIFEINVFVCEYVCQSS